MSESGPGAFGNCACLSEDAKRCTQRRLHLTDKQFDALDPDDRDCECVCHGDHDYSGYPDDDARRFEG